MLLLQGGERQQYEILESARFLMELAALDYAFVSQRPSRIALAALLNAMEEKKSTISPSLVCNVHEQHYELLLSLVAPSERFTVEQCRGRLRQLHAGLCSDDADVMHGAEPPAALDSGVASPVSVVHRGPLY